jgi:DNA-binding winged helix-turn-helix (wHTH) protein/Tol biopolymer transport system component
MKSANSQIFRVSGVEVHEGEFCLYKEGEKLAVEPKTFHLLLYFLRHPQRLIPKEELLNAVWGGAAVTENSLAQNIAKLRRQLGDDSRDPRYIETVATVGYRFVSDVEVAEDVQGISEPMDAINDSSGVQRTEESAGGDSAELPARIGKGNIPDPITDVVDKGTRVGRLRWLAAGIVLAVGLASAILYSRRPLPRLRVAEYTQITHDSRRKALIGTDGVRLFFNRYPGRQSPGMVATSGGEIVPIPVELPEPWILSLSPDASSLLVISHDGGRRSLWSAGVLGGSLRHLADGDFESATWSPDGKSVAYSTSNGDINVMRSEGTEVHRLGSVPYRSGSALFEQISWSPDGSTIRFDRNNRIFEIKPDGSGLHEFLPGWRPSSWQCCGLWTPDGRFFLFLEWDSPQQAYPLFPPFQVWSLDEHRGLPWRSPSEPVQLTSGPTGWGRPIPSKDGKKIFARGVNLNGEMVRFSPATHQLEPYLGGISAEGVSFSPDGKFVVYVTFPEGILWRANRDGSNPTQLTDPPLYPFLPRWSPDGLQILFTGLDAAADLKAYAVSAQGGVPKPVFPEDKEEQGDPNWSPDGSRICFDSWEGEGENTKHLIRILDLANHAITKLPEGYWSPRWSPDGRYMAALTSGTLNLAVFDFKTQRWSVLAKGQTGYPSWSRDGQFIYFLRVSADPGVYRIRPAGGAAERVVDLKGFHFTSVAQSWMGLDPEDAPILLRDLGGDDLYALTLDQK